MGVVSVQTALDSDVYAKRKIPNIDKVVSVDDRFPPRCVSSLCLKLEASLQKIPALLTPLIGECPCKSSFCEQPMHVSIYLPITLIPVFKSGEHI